MSHSNKQWQGQTTNQKHWCIYCRSFVYDNAISRQQHENQPKHKKNVQRFLERTNRQTEHQLHRGDWTRRQLEQIERAAVGAFAEVDGGRVDDETWKRVRGDRGGSAANASASTSSPATGANASAGVVPTVPVVPEAGPQEDPFAPLPDMLADGREIDALASYLRGEVVYTEEPVEYARPPPGPLGEWTVVAKKEAVKPDASGSASATVAKVTKTGASPSDTVSTTAASGHARPQVHDDDEDEVEGGGAVNVQGFEFRERTHPLDDDDEAAALATNTGALFKKRKVGGADKKPRNIRRK